MKKYYTPEFKAKIVSSYLTGNTVSELAQQNSISRSTIYIWIKASQREEDMKDTPVNLRAFHDLRVRCQRMETMIEILKAAPCCPSAPLAEKLNAVIQMSSKYNVNILCESLSVAKGSYYNHIKRNKKGNTLYAQKIKELTPIIEEIYHNSNQTYGAARVHAVLKDRGYHISESTVAKIMQTNGCLAFEGVRKPCMKQAKPGKLIFLIRCSLYPLQIKSGSVM